MLFDYLLAENSVEMSEEDADFIKALIAGDPERCGYRGKSFLFEIVANKRNGIDVDKLVVTRISLCLNIDFFFLLWRFDYIGRDTYAIGEKINISWSRLVSVTSDIVCLWEVH
jgi:hypothetical protein